MAFPGIVESGISPDSIIMHFQQLIALLHGWNSLFTPQWHVFHANVL
jgi:hypothetical protein